MSAKSIDMLIVAIYFAVVLLAGYLISRKHKSDSASDFISGGHNLNWIKTGLTLVAMSVDTGIMAFAGLGFVFGLVIQWNAVNLWITASFAGMFLIPIYWRSGIVTTPELLEKRFNVHCRISFSIMMTFIMIAMLTTMIYLGAVILNKIFAWNVYIGAGAICAVAAFYVMLGGMKTVLTINLYQSVFMIACFIAIAAVALYKIGGISGFASIKMLSDAGTLMPSTIPPNDWDIFTENWFPLPGVIFWAPVLGMAWIACNFGMVQRLLAARSECDAQKAILFVGCWNMILCLLGYVVGISMRVLMPEIQPDTAYITLIWDMFPVGLRGLVIAGLMASLLSTVDGYLTASSTLVTKDIFLRFINPNASGKTIKTFARVMMAVVAACVMFLIPVAAKYTTVMQFVQGLFGDVLGVVIALYLVGIFSKRATPKAAFVGMITGLVLAIYLHAIVKTNLVYYGMFSFAGTVLVTLIGSLFEKPLSEEKLQNLTVHTVSDAKGPFIGLSSWPNLWKWALALPIFWFSLTALWEWYIRSN